MSKVLLDTDILSEILKGKSAVVTARAGKYLAQQGCVTTSAITVAEIVFGFRRVGREDRVTLFEASLDTAEVLALDDAAARLAGRINADLERVGRVIGMPDVLIAAIALRNGLPIVTGNVTHFEQVRLIGYDLYIDNGGRRSAMASRGRMASKSLGVTPFPPIPKLPKPPQFPADPRQSSSAHVIGAIGGIARGTMHVSGPNLSTGFHASAVELGSLQSVLERGLARFDDGQLEARWNEVFDWIRRVARSWVQRCKKMHIERRELGIRIELETQDDLGHYEYGFDVFPRRKARAK